MGFGGLGVALLISIDLCFLKEKLSIYHSKSFKKEKNCSIYHA